MKQKMKWRYFCDFCKKSMGSRRGMEKHESRCTLNPRRECGICLLRDGGIGYISECLEVLKPHAHDVNIEILPDIVVEKLRETAGYCPSCMYAALRQSGLEYSMPNKYGYMLPQIDAEYKILMADLHDEYRNIVGHVK